MNVVGCRGNRKPPGLVVSGKVRVRMGGNGRKDPRILNPCGDVDYIGPSV